ncbi:MAG: FitA-like ribbon-helix-helix domain-containing protein [Ardenticatenaceae bacterium]
MATLHVRNIPDELYGRLKQYAQAQNRSLSAQVISLLNQAIEHEAQRSQQQQLLDEIRRCRFVYSNEVNVEDSVTLLREERER